MSELDPNMTTWEFVNWLGKKENKKSEDIFNDLTKNVWNTINKNLSLTKEEKSENSRELLMSKFSREIEIHKPKLKGIYGIFLEDKLEAIEWDLVANIFLCDFEDDGYEELGFEEPASYE